jgi:hypothetical protein
MTAGPQPEPPIGSTLRSRLDNSRAAPSEPPRARRRTEAPRPLREPLSPELALVDPELAARARAALPRSPVRADRGRRPSVPPYVQPRPTSPGPSEFTAERGRPKVATGIAFAAIVMLLAAGVVGGLWLRKADEPANRSAVANRDPASPEPKPNPPAPTRPAPAPAPPRRPAGPIPPRTFAWAAVPGANRYRVELFRRGSKILDSRTRAARLVLPARWRYRGRRIMLRPGRYWWRVRPAFGAASRERYGRPVVSAALVISPGGTQ